MSANQKIAYLLVVVLAAILRFTNISTASLWLDEHTSLEIAAKSYVEILSGTKFDSHTPPFYYLLLKSWFALFPVDEFGLRSLSAVLDIVNVILVFTLGSSWFDNRRALLASLLHALSPFAIFYAQEGRMYSLLLLLALSTLLLLRSSNKTFVRHILLCLVGMAGLYTHYYYALFLVGLGAALLFEIGLLAALRKMIPLICSLLAFLPWMKVVVALAAGPGQIFREYLWLTLPYTAFRFFVGYGVMPLNMEERSDLVGTAWEHFGLIVLLAAIGAFTILRGMRIWSMDAHESFRFMFIASSVVIFLAVLLSLRTPMMGDRYFIVLFPTFLFLLACSASGCGLMNGLVLVTLLAVETVGVCAMKWRSDFGKEQWREAAQFVVASNEETYPIYVCPSFFGGVLQFYLPDDFDIRVQPCENFSNDDRGWIVEHGLVYRNARRKVKPLLELKLPLENGIVVRLAERSGQ